MKKNIPQSGSFNPRVFLSFILCSAGVWLAMACVVPPQREASKLATALDRDMPVPGGKADDLNRMEEEWNNRLTYPTGLFDPQWLRVAAVSDSLIARAVPAGVPLSKSVLEASPLALSPSGFTSLGPAPLQMTGCSGCYNYTKTEGRVNSIAVDPTTTTNGSIVAYLGSVGGGVWKTTNCCSTSTSWTVTTDDPLLSTITIDSITIDPNNHNTIYAGTGDLNYGSFSMGSQGILKSTDAGASWTLLGANVFGPALPEPPDVYFPQYNAVGKVRVDPNNSNNVVAGTKTGLYFSYDGGNNWTGPCTTNSYSTQRQDITGLELTNVGGTTRIVAAVGVRGFPSTVQYNLGQNGANGIYKGTMPASGCPGDFTSIASNANGFVLTTTSPPSTTLLNAGSGTPCNYPISGGTGTCVSTTNQLGRIDIAVAPSDPNYIYAQAQSIKWNTNSGCGSTTGCQLGAWRTTDGGTTWTQVDGSPGASLKNCGNQAGDYAQNWYDQGVAVDPNDPNRVFFDTFEIWFWKSGSPSWSDTTCGYSGSTEVVHVDQHALAFVPGSSSILLAGSDGGVFATINADGTNGPTHLQWFNMDNGLNTIEFYSGDISGNFATSASPQANGGAQDNGSSSVTFSGSPTGPVQWQMGKGGDGFYARIDPVGTGGTTPSLRFWQGNNNGHLSRCTSNCTAGGAGWSDLTGGWTSDVQSFVLPYEIYKGDPSLGPTADCAPASATTGCGHLIVGTQKVWETITGAAASVNWYANSPNLIKSPTTLGNRAFINQLAFEPLDQTRALVGTNDGNVQYGHGLGTGAQNTATWVDITGTNAVLPNRPILDVAMDPTTTTSPIGYAAVGGFNANTPSTPGHVFRVVCTADCAMFTWSDKSGNLPDIPVDSIIANPKFPQQVFAGTDWGLYYTNDITVASPIWYRFDNGLPHAMIWDMAIDRGSTTLSVWTRSRGAYVWPLPSAAILPPPLTGVVSRKTHGGLTPPPVGPGDLALALSGTPTIEPRAGGGTSGSQTLVFSFTNTLTAVGGVSATATTSSGQQTIPQSNITGTRSGNLYQVDLTGVPNASHLSVTLHGATDSQFNFGDVTQNMDVLYGDVNQSGNVDAADVGQVQRQNNQAVTTGNYLKDVNISGNIDAADVGQVQRQNSKHLP